MFLAAQFIYLQKLKLAMKNKGNNSKIIKLHVYHELTRKPIDGLADGHA